MKYFIQHKEPDAKAEEITKEKAKSYLEGNWKQEYLDDIFDNGKSFRLWTPFSYIWTKTDDGLEPMAGFVGVVGE